MKGTCTALVALVMALTVQAVDEPKAPAPEPPVVFVLGPGQGTATPTLHGCAAHTGGGNIHVTQPTPDTIHVTMTGVAVAGGNPCKGSSASLAFQLAQGFEVAFNDPKVKGAKLVLWARVIGLLRSDHSCRGKKGGTAEICTAAHAAVNCGEVPLVALDLPPRSVADGHNLSVHDRDGPAWAPVVPGRYMLHQAFGIAAEHDKGFFCKSASAEFAPDPALDTEWISKKEPFHGAAKKDFGFQVILKVVPDEAGNGKDEKP
ncbi:MAG: hypothetical protein K2R98_09870 [Gemmataceae bacterium]|nr:hypothetical protein [Gemmataceae bacterium]